MSIRCSRVAISPHSPIRHDRFDAFCRINSYRRRRRAWMKSRRVAAMVNRGLTTSVILCADRFTADSFPARVIAGCSDRSRIESGSYPVSIPRNDSALPPLDDTVRTHVRAACSNAAPTRATPTPTRFANRCTRGASTAESLPETRFSAVFVILLDRLNSSRFTLDTSCDFSVSC